MIGGGETDGGETDNGGTDNGGTDGGGDELLIEGKHKHHEHVHEQESSRSKKLKIILATTFSIVTVGIGAFWCWWCFCWPWKQPDKGGDKKNRAVDVNRNFNVSHAMKKYSSSTGWKTAIVDDEFNYGDPLLDERREN